MGDVLHDLLARFRWVDGHADLWPLLYDPTAFRLVVTALAAPFREAQVTKVAGIEARGFVLGAAVATNLGAGFVAVRKSAGIFPGPKLSRITPPDYRGETTELRLQERSVSPGDRIGLVDDWCQTGSQAVTARAMIEEAGAEYVGMSIIVDQMATDARVRLSPSWSLIEYESLPSGG